MCVYIGYVSLSDVAASGDRACVLWLHALLRGEHSTNVEMLWISEALNTYLRNEVPTLSTPPGSPQRALSERILQLSVPQCFAEEGSLSSWFDNEYTVEKQTALPSMGNQTDGIQLMHNAGSTENAPNQHNQPPLDEKGDSSASGLAVGYGSGAENVESHGENRL